MEIKKAMRISSIILIFLIFSTPATSFAFDCTKAKTETEKAICSVTHDIPFILNKGIENRDCDEANFEKIIYSPPSQGKIIGNSRVYFYKSPEFKCKSTNLFLIKNDEVMVYRTSINGKFSEVMFVTKGGNIVLNWMESKDIKITGPVGR